MLILFIDLMWLFSDEHTVISTVAKYCIPCSAKSYTENNSQC